MANMDKTTRADRVPHVRTSVDVRYLYDGVNAGRIVTQPEFQRRFWWGDELQVGLITTIIKGCIIPEIFTYYYREKGIEEVVDGQQRLETIRRFVNGEFSLSKQYCDVRGIAGMTFANLSDELKNIIMSYPMSVCRIYSDDISDDTKIDIFVRLNPKVKGMGIKYQEARNAIFKGKFNNFIKKLSEEKSFMNVFNIDEEHERMLDVETVLVFITSLFNKFKWWDQQKSLSAFMSYMSKEVEKMSDDHRRSFFDETRRKFLHGIQCSLDVFGNRAFCERSPGRTGRFSRKAFITLMNGFQDYSYSRVSFFKNQLRDRINKWIIDDKNSWEGMPSRTISAFGYRDSKMKDILKEIIGEPQKQIS